MKAGDTIKCVGPIEGCGGVTIGKYYTVDRMDGSNDPFITNDYGNITAYMRHRFEVVTIHSQIKEAMNMIGKTVEYEGDVFVVTHWGIANEFSNSYDDIRDNMENGVCVYVENDEYIAPLKGLMVLENTVVLNDEYTAKIVGDTIQVGCQTILISKVEEILETYRKTKQ